MTGRPMGDQIATRTDATGTTVHLQAAETAEQSTTWAYATLPAGPVWKVEIASTTDPLASSPTWVDVSEWVDMLETTAGRDDELDDASPGRARIVFDDPTRELGPGLLAEPSRRIRVTTTAPVAASVFHGLIDDISTLVGRGREIAVEIAAVDMLCLLAADTVSTFEDGIGDGDTTGQRITRVLDTVGIPAALRSVDTGRSYLLAHTATTESALVYANKVTRTEDGRLTAAGDGTITFQERYAITPAVSLVITDAGTGDVVPPVVLTRYGIDRVITVAEVEWAAGRIQTIDNDATPYRARRARQFTTFIDTELRAVTYSEWILMLRSTPLRRISSAQFVCTNSAMTVALLGVERGTRVQLVRTPDVGDPITVTATVERITWRAEGMVTTCTLGFTPVPDFTPWTWADKWDDASTVWAY
ncbi:MAG: hypothetical protein GY925_26630 [Actinomycetia bacterium]|nr:hypothetical protein [Actinomycetes bacterium]